MSSQLFSKLCGTPLTLHSLFHSHPFLHSTAASYMHIFPSCPYWQYLALHHSCLNILLLEDYASLSFICIIAAHKPVWLSLLESQGSISSCKPSFSEKVTLCFNIHFCDIHFPSSPNLDVSWILNILIPVNCAALAIFSSYSHASKFIERTIIFICLRTTNYSYSSDKTTSSGFLL